MPLWIPLGSWSCGGSQVIAVHQRRCLCVAFGGLTASREDSRFNTVTGMSTLRIQVGQVWRKNDNDETFLVTRLYSEALATIAILRPTGAANSALLRIRVERSDTGQTLPGFSIAHSLE